MRKITKQAVAAFNAGRDWKSGNTEVCVEGDTVSLYLHGNCIAARPLVSEAAGSLRISNQGWSTVTTKDRLNALDGVSISQKNFQWYLNGKLWDGSWVNVQEWDEGTRK